MTAARRADLTAALDRWRVLLDELAPLTGAVEEAGRRLIDVLAAGGKVLTCGNGGSACDALHLAEELLGRYRSDRRPLPAVCLNADPAYLTCAANDFGFDAVFARAVRGLAAPGDVVVGFSTSGRSPNILAAFDAAREAGAFSIGLLGGDGGPARERCDLPIVVPARGKPDTPRVQEAHGLILHVWCETIEDHFASKE